MKSLTLGLIFVLSSFISNVSTSQEHDLFNTSSCATEIPSGENNNAAFLAGTLSLTDQISEVLPRVRIISLSFWFLYNSMKTVRIIQD
jgi:hypothetical protein